MANGLMGQIVSYTDRSGHRKPALVIADPTTLGDTDAVPALSDGERHLFVFGMSGQTYTRYAVPCKGSAGAEAEDAEGRSWEAL